jgi:hypothetical protein
MDQNQLLYILSRLTPENKSQIFRVLQLQSAQSGEPLSPELQAYFNAPADQEEQAWTNLLGTLGPKAPATGYEGFKQSLLGQGQFGIQPHLSSLENIVQRLNSPEGYTGNPMQSMGRFNQGSSYMGAQQAAQQPQSLFTRGVNAAGKTLQDLSPSIAALGAGTFGPLGVLAGPLAGGLGGYAAGYGQNPALKGINPTFGF